MTDSNNNVDLVLPCYNPPINWSGDLIKNFHDLTAELSEYNFSLIVVNDGSTRNFNEEVDVVKTAIPNVKIVSYENNMGKGYAVRQGIKQATCHYSIYTDYDFPYTTSSIEKVLNKLKENNDVVIGTRNKSYYKALNINRMFFTIGSKVFNFFILRLKHMDTQGGIKGMSAYGRRFLLQTTINRFLFDTEFIKLASKDKQCKVKSVFVALKDGVLLPNMGAKVFKSEFKNLLKLIRL